MRHPPSSTAAPKVEIFGYCSVDSETRFILGIHGNYDPAADAFEVNAKSARAVDMGMKEPYRKYARYWLAGDDLSTTSAGSTPRIVRA